ncbi:MAG: hypothetical protein ACYC9S_03540 [Leptospirales bacterium]
MKARVVVPPLNELLRSWIPPFGILFGLGAFCLSWLLMIAGGVKTSPDTGVPLWIQLAWVHTLAIGFFTMTALSVLFHVMPAFTGTPWKNETLARKLLPILALGVAGIIGFFLSDFSSFWIWGFPLAAGAIFLWGLLFFSALVRGIVKRRAVRSPLAIFLLPAAFLMLTVSLGLVMGIHLGFPPPPGWIVSRGIPVHLAMGLLGWLTILLWIVSSRTQQPILGVHSTHPARIQGAVGLMMAGLALYIPGQFFFSSILCSSGALIMVLASLVYLAESIVLLYRASSPHPVLWAWWATGVAGLFASLVAGILFLLADFQEAPDLFVYLAMMAWIQPFLLGHLHQIGVRLLATIVRGPEDQTPPSRLLSDFHAWGFWSLYLSGMLTGLVGVGLQNGVWIEIAGTLGVLSSIILFLHIGRIIRKCRMLPALPLPPVTLIRFPPS